jgi:hypothetical protein
VARNQPGKRWAWFFSMAVVPRLMAMTARKAGVLAFFLGIPLD